jgi:hypothetical protein
LGFSETTKSLDAQNQYLGAKVMNDLGFTQRFIKIQDAECRKREARIREIGRSLGWPQDRSLSPSIGWLSRKVKREKQYNFLYHATSRFVHFSQQELLRRVWSVYRKLKLGRSGGEGRQGWRVIGGFRFAEPDEKPVHLYPMTDAF